MSKLILNTKLYIPPLGPKVVLRPHLTERLDEGLQHKLTLISAPAGSGKTTLLSGWVTGCGRPVCWLSLDEGDNDPKRFLTYLIAALQTIQVKTGEGILGLLHSPQTPPIESIMTSLLNEISSFHEHCILVLDDYHVIDTKPIDDALAFLLEHLPPHLHIVIATREDPSLPLARLRAKSQLTELRAADLRFTHSEIAQFLNQVMGLNLLAEDISILETRTEGWIAGLQLAAIALQGKPSMHGYKDSTSFITSFTGSHRFVLDYLVEEVLQQQSTSVQRFLMCTSILDRLCGSLCDAVCSGTTGQATLEYLEHANLFIVPLDNERCWYRYHHLFGSFLFQRLQQSNASSTGNERESIAELHLQASRWYEENGLEIEAFQHAVAAKDVERAARLIEGKGMPLHFRGAVTPVLNWLKSLPKTELDARPSLWVMYASALSMTGQTNEVEQKLQAAEAALQGTASNDKTRNLIGHIAAIRALLAALQNQVETIITQSHRALEYLHPDNVAVRTATIWKLGIAYQLRGDRVAASQAYNEAISISRVSGNTVINISANYGLGSVQESQNQLYPAAETYRHVLELIGDQPQPGAIEAHLGLARIYYQWNDLDVAEQHAQQGFQLAQQLGNTDRLVACEVMIARLKIVRGDVDDAAEAAAVLARASQIVHQYNTIFPIPEVNAAYILSLLHQGNLMVAEHLAQTNELPISQARVYLAQGDTSAALTVLRSYRQQIEAKGWEDELLKVMVLQAIAHHAHGEKCIALQLLSDVLALAQPGGFIRIFVDEGVPMARLLSEAIAQGIMPDYINKLLIILKAEKQQNGGKNILTTAQSLIEPLSEREVEVLQLIAQGLSNQEICAKLFLALDTVKGHNRRIYDKLQVQRRTEAVARARELGLF